MGSTATARIARSRPGAHEQCIEDETRGDREAKGDQPVHGNRRPGDGDRDREIRIAVVLPAEQDEGDALHDEEQAEGRQDRVDLEASLVFARRTRGTSSTR